MTSQLYRSVGQNDSLSAYDAGEFEQRYRRHKDNYALPAVFNGFYDGRYPDITDWDIDTLAADGAPAVDASQLFSEDNSQLQRALDSNRQDLETLKAIQKRKIPITRFDFDGVKEIGSQAKHRDALDRTAFLFFLHRDDIDKDLLKARYRHFQKAYDRAEEFVAIVNRLMTRIRPLYTQKLTIGQVTQLIATLKANEEAALKRAYNQILDEGLLPTREILSFLQKQYAYFISGEFLNDELNDLTGLARQTAEQLNQHRFNAYKSMLEVQAATVRSLPEKFLVNGFPANS
jgi:hypothetical protein